MFVTTLQQKHESHNNELLPRRQSPGTRSVRILAFNSGGSHYAVEMSELKQVIRDLLSIQTCTPPSIITGFMKRNRGETIVFNLDSCLNIQQGIMKKERKSSILILDEIISGSRVGVLVAGNLEILKMNCPKTRNGLKTGNGDALPVRGIVRNKKPTGAAADDIELIDIRALVENCIVRLGFGMLKGAAAQTA
jgi:chemotaxis signal transduction protein